MGENVVGRKHRGLRNRMERFARIRSANRALPAAASDMAGAERRESEATSIRARLAELAGMEAPAAELAKVLKQELRTMDAGLDAMRSDLLVRFDRLDFVALRASIPRSVERNRREVIALLEVLLGERSQLEDRLPQVEYLITVLSTEEVDGRRNIVHDPTLITPMIETFRVEGLDAVDADALAMELYQAATLDSDSENFEEILRALRERKKRIGISCLAPSVLRAVVTYNARMFNSVESMAEASRASDAMVDAELLALDDLEEDEGVFGDLDFEEELPAPALASAPVVTAPAEEALPEAASEPGERASPDASVASDRPPIAERSEVDDAAAALGLAPSGSKRGRRRDDLVEPPAAAVQAGPEAAASAGRPATDAATGPALEPAEASVGAAVAPGSEPSSGLTEALAEFESESGPEAEADPEEATAVETETAPVHQSKALGAVLMAFRQRIAGDVIGRRGSAERIAIVLDQSALEEVELDAIRAEKPDREQTLVARTAVLGLILRDLGPIDSEVTKLGFDRHQLTDEWVRALNEELGQLVSAKLGDTNAYEQATQLSRVKSKHLLGPMTALKKAADLGSQDSGADAAGGRSAPRGVQTRSARDRRGAAGSGGDRRKAPDRRGSGSGSGAGVSLGAGRFKIVAAAALVAISLGLMAMNLIETTPEGIRQLTGGALSDSSRFLKSAYRNDSGRGPLLIGRVDTDFIGLPLDRRIEEANAMAQNFESQGIREAMLYDDRGLMHVHYAAGVIHRPRPAVVKKERQGSGRRGLMGGLLSKSNAEADDWDDDWGEDSDDAEGGDAE